MKSTATIIAITLFSISSFASEITLDPGSTAIVEASERTKVICSGSSDDSSSKKTCKVLNRKDVVKKGFERYCESYYTYCALVLRYGQPVDWTKSDSASALARWCDKQTN